MPPHHRKPPATYAQHLISRRCPRSYGDSFSPPLRPAYGHSAGIRTFCRSERFEGPAQEFAKAHQHYRKGEDKAAVQEATKALESTIKAICHARKWVPKENATVKLLLDFIFEKELIPPWLSAVFGGLRSALESGLPAIGNREARHGQGKDVKAIERHMVEFALPCLSGLPTTGV